MTAVYPPDYPLEGSETAKLAVFRRVRDEIRQYLRGFPGQAGRATADPPAQGGPTVKRSSLRQPGKPLVEVTRESIAIRLRERWRTAADIAASTHGVHEVPHREYASDRVS
jgi:hypothetical protein